MRSDNSLRGRVLGLALCGIGSLTLHASPALADYPVLSMDSLLIQKGAGNERYGAFGTEVRIDSGGAAVPGLIYHGYDSFEVDARLIDDSSDPFDLTVFGGVGGRFWQGTDLFGANFDPSQYRIEVTFKPGANNEANRFDIAFDQHDGFSDAPSNTQSQGERYAYRFPNFEADYADAVTNGLADANGFVTLSRGLTELPNPISGSETAPWDEYGATATGFAGPGDMELDFGAIEDGARNGVGRIQLRSTFGSFDRLNIVVKDIRVVPLTPEVEVARIDAATAFTSDFGSAETPGAVDRTGDNLLLNLNGFGGVQVQQAVTSFDGTQYGVEVKAKLLGSNTAESFSIVAKDLDGNDTAAGEGAEEWGLPFSTSLFNAGDFSTVTLPLSDASANSAFGFTNSGDGSIADFDLFTLQVASAFGAETMLGIEIESVKVVPFTAPVLPGDYNNDGMVNAADYTVWRDGGSPDSSQAGYDIWANNYGAGGSTAQAVPEPISNLLVLSAVSAVAALRGAGRSRR